MGIYVSEINMPKGEGSKLVLQIFPNGEVYDEHGIRLGIANWAKAVPVPPHGDLIDRREAIIDANERSYDFWLSDDEVNASIQFLKEQPTIIPAELEEEEMK